VSEWTMMQSRSSQAARGSAELSEDRWHQWQLDVLDVIRSDFSNILDSVEWDDIDWEAWRPLFEEGCSPQDAVQNAFGQVA